MNSTFKTGVGCAVITPAVGTILYGYAPGRPSESAHDDLRVTSLAFESKDTRTLLISADICTFNMKSSRSVRRQIADATGVPVDHILFCPTHTHSGPAASAGVAWGQTDEAFNKNILIPNVIASATEACDTLQEAVMGIGVTQSDIGINRRQIRRDGTICLGQNPWGPYNPEMTVLSFRTPGGDPIANLIHYGCHGTAAGKNPEITRDWPGPMVDRLEEESGAVTVFFNGAEGDIGPRLPNGQTKGTLAMALELGARAGFDAVRAWRTIKEYRAVPVHVLAREIQLPFRPLPDLETARKEVAAMGDPEKLVKKELKKFNRWKNVVEEIESGRPPQTHLQFQQSIVALGPVAVVPFPYEIFVEITLRVQQLSPFQHTLCLSNANGSGGYFPTRQQFVLGGYEIFMANHWGPYLLTEDADTAMVEANLQLLETLADLRIKDDG